MNQENQTNIFFIDKKLAIKVIMDCKTISAHKFRTKLRLKKYDFLTKEQPVLIRIISSFEGENMQTQYYILG